MRTGSLVQRGPVDITTRSRLDTPNRQMELNGLGILTAAFATARFGRSMPPFTTEDFALLPFYVDQQAIRGATKSNMTAKTTSLFAQLTCVPAAAGKPKFYKKDADDMVEWEIHTANSSRRDTACSYFFRLHYQPLGIPDLWMEYFGVHFNKTGPFRPGDFALSSKCPLNSSPAKTAMIISALQPPSRWNSTVDQIRPQTCERRYYKQEVMATVSASDFKVYPESVRPLSDPSPLLPTEFDIFNFEQLLLQNSFRLGYDDQGTKYQFPSNLDEVEKWMASYHPSFYDPSWIITSRMLLFADALYTQNSSAGAKADPEAIEKAIYRAHKYLFSYAASSTLANQTGHQLDNQTATLATPAYGILVSFYFATAAECLLLLIAIIALTLLYFCRKAQCHLQSNPNSISRLCRICNASPGIINLYKTLATNNGKQLESLLKDCSFRLSHCGCADQCQLWLEQVKPSAVHPGYGQTGQARPSESANAHADHYKPAIPFEVTRKAGTLLITILLGVIPAFAILKWQEVSQAGKFSLLVGWN
ncbi:hypothetical protein CDD81_6715 [Ophiocordyceps australis]|uniref:Uncharacterized protein n=1 Tax=Ophiocordyceps australis TaxID=1399860 RepID=A0A2C5Y214_9HYPO|nr:hypothetical protein CDD81_6715 [Ophiocordyceps australis]